MSPKETSKTDQQIYTAISNIMGKVGVVGKEKKNEQQGYKFRGIDDMYNALNKHLSEEGVFATSTLVDKVREERQSKSGATLIYTILTIRFDFFAKDGSSVSSTTVGEAMDSGDKSANKAMSTAYKYALMQLFCIPTEEEKDTEHTTHEVTPKTARNEVKKPLPVPKTDKPLITPEQAFDNASDAIFKAESTERLGNLDKQIQASKILTDEQKQELSDMCQEAYLGFEPGQ